jgi:hypothetical protein
MNCNNRQNP